MSSANPIRDEIVQWLSENLPLDRERIEALLEAPPSAEMGDYGLPCFTLAAQLRKAPAQIAAELASRFPTSQQVPKAVAAGPYVNFFVSRSLMSGHVLREICELGDNYGHSSHGAGKTIVIDYSSPNIAKHLGVHHLRSAIIGRSLGRILGALDYKCVGINYLGDWGTSFGKLIAAFERYTDLNPQTATVSDLQDAYVRFNLEAEQNADLKEEARRAFRRLESGEPKAMEIWKRFKSVSLAEFERIYELLGVSFDHYMSESFHLGQVEDLLNRLKKAGLAQISEDALIVPLEKYDLPPVMLLKGDETTLYSTRDICATEYRWQKYHFERALYVVGAEQKLYFRQLRKVLELMRYEWAERIEHIDFGLLMLRDLETGQARKGATRRGEIILLEDVLREGLEKARQKIQENLDRLEEGADLDRLARDVGIGAVVFSDLCVKRSKNVIFDWDRMLDFEGDTGPYVQYAHARLCSILRKAGQPVSPVADCSQLVLPEEWALVRRIEDFPTKIRAAADGREPSIIANYLLELCALFSSYYSAGMKEPERRVLCEDAGTRAARLLLVNALRQVIFNGLTLLGVATPERM